jgi:PilX N-terminal
MLIFGFYPDQRANTLRRRHQGMITMIMSMLMLFIVSILIFYTNKGIWLEQRSATNQYRAKQAQTAAEAGLEYAISVLNSTSGSPNRTSYLTASSNQPGKYIIANNSISGTPGSALAYLVQILPIQGDSSPYERFLLSSEGGSDCSTSGTLGTCNGRAVTRQVIKLTPVLLNPPDDSASVYGNFSINGSGTIENSTGVGYPLKTRDTAITITGGASNISGSLTTGNCASSRALCGAFSEITSVNAFFASYFGSSTTDVKSLTTPITDASTLSTSSSGLIWHQGNLSLNQSVGTLANPVLLIVDGDLTIQGNRDIYGFVYVTGKMAYNGNVSIQGAVATGGDFDINGGGGTQNLSKNPDVLNRLKESASSFNKVLGTWQDW